MPVPILAMELARDRLSKRALHRATLAAQVYTPADAVAAGYLDEAVPAEQLLDRAKAEAARLGAYSRQAYAATKQRLRSATIEHIKSTLESDMKAFTVG
jgi:enoyl-CoA hydratase